jgi:hypothetical protein
MSWLTLGKFDNSSGVEAAQKPEDNNNNRTKNEKAGRLFFSVQESFYSPVKMSNAEMVQSACCRGDAFTSKGKDDET